VSERGASLVDDGAGMLLAEPAVSQDHPAGYADAGDAGNPERSQHENDHLEAEPHHSDGPDVRAGETSRNEAKGMTWDESVSLPEIGALVRCKTSLLRSPRRTSGRVKAIVSQEYGPTVVIESVWGDEVIVTASEYSRFFELCDPRDLAREYWEGS
jgi:hypothetical protein